MQVTLLGGPHDGRNIDVDNLHEHVGLPVLAPRSDGTAADLSAIATYHYLGRRDLSGIAPDGMAA